MILITVLICIHYFYRPQTHIHAHMHTGHITPQNTFNANTICNVDIHFSFDNVSFLSKATAVATAAVLSTTAAARCFDTVQFKNHNIQLRDRNIICVYACVHNICGKQHNIARAQHRSNCFKFRTRSQ